MWVRLGRAGVFYASLSPVCQQHRDQKENRALRETEEVPCQAQLIGDVSCSIVWEVVMVTLEGR